MDLKVRLLKWSAGIPVAMLNRKTADKIGIHAKGRVSIKTNGRKSKEMAAICNRVIGLVKENEVAVSAEIKNRLGLKAGQKISIELLNPPETLELIKKKLNNNPLTEKEINAIIKDIVNNSLSEAEIALFVSSMYDHKMSLKETIYLTKAILKSGNLLKLNKKIIVDKHSIGGVPGNRTTPLVVSICAAGGLTFPKNSSRAITSAAGTADVIETVAEIDFSIKELKKIVNKTNACMVWGGALGIVPADSKIIEVEKELKLDPEAQLLASIMSKKLAVGSDYILIDIPYGKNAKVTKRKALHLAKKFEKIGNYFHKKIKVVLTKGNEPIGNGIGPCLELKDIIKIFNLKSDSPKDLEKKSLFLAGEIFELCGKVKKGKGINLATEILKSGKAYDKFKEIIKAQRGKLNGFREAKFKKNILSKRSGKIFEIGNKKINSLARVAGCPSDKCSGLYLYKHVGAKVKKGEIILTVYSESKSRLNKALAFYKSKRPITIR